MKIKFDTLFESYNNKVVKCTLKCTVYDLKPHFNLIGFGEEILINDAEVTANLNLPYGRCAYSFTVKGIAKCSEGDKFNETLGRRISESKATIKACKIASEICYRIYKDLMAKSTSFSDDAYRIENILKGEIEHLEMLKNIDD